jgi:hypothetical protein
MKEMILGLGYLGVFGFLWPYYIAGRTRGAATMIACAVPFFAALFGWFAK